jgi:hypothetical protein
LPVLSVLRFPVPVDFDSLTDKHRIAPLWAGAALTVRHIGDHGPLGRPRLQQRARVYPSVCAAYGGNVEFVLLAVTPEQAAL